MSSITADSMVQHWLAQLSDVTEIRDVQGNLLGIFTPKSQAEEELLYERAQKLFDPVEMERRAREEKGRGRPFAEVIKRLEAMDPS